VAAADVEVHWVASKPPLLAHESEFHPFNVLGGGSKVDHEVPPCKRKGSKGSLRGPDDEKRLIPLFFDVL
jgi:hypothetical protein